MKTIQLNDHPIEIVVDDRERASEAIAFLQGIPERFRSNRTPCLW